MIPSWLPDKLANPPEAGTGLHAWLYSCARQLHAHWSPAEILDALESATRKCARPVPMREIRDAVNNSRSTAWTRGEKREDGPVVRNSLTSAQETRWPDTDPIKRENRIQDSIADGVRTVSDLTDRSVPIDGDAGAWIDRMFPDAEWLCLAKGHPGSARSRKREKWLFESSDHDLIVPSPMTGPSGKGLDGRLSHRCLGNTGARKWLVVEFDSGTLDEQASLHWFLRGEASQFGLSLRIVVFSGSKSLHGWYGPATDEDRCRAFMEFAVIHGADYATMNRSQLVRLPMGIRRIPSTKISLPDWEFPAGEIVTKYGTVKWTENKWPENFLEPQQILYAA